MTRRRIWEINCFALDAVLCTSFDADELLSIDSKLRSACEIPDHPGVLVPRPLIVYGVAHKACHSENPTSCRIEKRLDAMHERALEVAGRADNVDVLTTCYAASEGEVGDLAGCLWSVLTDPRQDLRQQGLFWLQGLMIRSLTCWMRSGHALPEKGPGTVERDRLKESEE
ncbi:MAG: hypothetical protein HY293_13505 [Planctomycetes bacterium]|nr:hypothetical protein [Planctomycetota bacterium]